MTTKVSGSVAGGPPGGGSSDSSTLTPPSANIPSGEDLFAIGVETRRGERLFNPAMAAHRFRTQFATRAQELRR